MQTHCGLMFERPPMGQKKIDLPLLPAMHAHYRTAAEHLSQKGDLGLPCVRHFPMWLLPESVAELLDGGFIGDDGNHLGNKQRSG